MTSPIDEGLQGLGFHRFASSDEVALFVMAERGTAVVLGTTGDEEVAEAARSIVEVLANDAGVDRLCVVIDAHRGEVRQVTDVRTVLP